MLAQVKAPALNGLEGKLVTIECDLSNGLPAFIVVGLADKAIEEAKERVRSAIKHSNLVLPPKRITLNLAPADTPKDGSAFDLPMAIALLAASGQIEYDMSSSLFCGELGLDGSLRSIPGILSYSLFAKQNNLSKMFVPHLNASEAAVIEGLQVFPVTSLFQLYRHLIGQELISPAKPKRLSKKVDKITTNLSEIYGQEQAKRAIEIAAAGNHNILLSGPPGTGKTLLAKSLISLLPKPSFEESIQITQLHNLALPSQRGLLVSRPFRQPHHTASAVALIGGGHHPKPGEISLSHNGVLFLDELPEFPRSVLEVLRQPLEDGEVTVARATGVMKFPARFLLVATQNPCPCGYAGDELRQCDCSPGQINRYLHKLSGPLLDRIDLIVQVGRVDRNKLLARQSQEDSQTVAKRIAAARDIQTHRFGQSAITNASMSNSEIGRYCQLERDSEELLRSAVSQLNLSARAYMRSLKVARTIADLAGQANIASSHLAEALQYRAR